MSYSATSKRRRDVTKSKFKVMGDHCEFLSRIERTLYYGKLPLTERFSLPVSELAAEFFTEVKQGHSIQRLDLEEAAAISRKACVSPCSLVLALLYLERLKGCNSEYLQRVAPSELFVISMMVASKFLNDDGEEDEVFNDEWAASAGVDVKDINRFERDFLHAIGWEVYVSQKAFWTRLCGLEKDVALREGKKRGWFTYTDLDQLLEHIRWAGVAQAVLSVSVVCLTSYTASVLTLLGSAFLVSHIPGSSLSASPITVSVNCPVSSQQALLQVDSKFTCNDTNNGETTAADFHGLDIYDSEAAYEYLMKNANTTDLTLIQWSEYYLTWQWWRSFLYPLKERNHSQQFEGITIVEALTHNEGKFEIEYNVRSATEESQEWVSLIKSWLDQTLIWKGPQTISFPIEVSVSC